MIPHTPSDPALTLVSINIERSKHLERVFSFLAAARAEIVCLQELVEDDMPEFRERLGYAHSIYAPLSRHPHDGLRSHGTGIFSRRAFERSEIVAYAGEGSGSDVLDMTSMHTKFRTSRYAVVLVSVSLGGGLFSIANTHFPWTPDGLAAEFQRTAADSLMAALAGRELVLCGDFNAPRGGEIFARLAERWHDNVPAHYVSSVDPILHRAGPLRLMVDGLFSTPGYQVCDVALHTGVSDHCALSAVVHAQEPHCSATAANSSPAIGGSSDKLIAQHRSQETG